MVGVVIGARLGILPDHIAIPIHFLKTAKTTWVIPACIQQISIFEQFWIRAHFPGMGNTAFHVNQVTVTRPREQGVAVIGLGFIPVASFG